MNKTSLRSLVKKQRQTLSREQQEAHARAITLQLSNQLPFKKAEHLALYLPVHGEVDTGPIAHEARKMGKQLYLPVLSPDDQQHLCFMPFEGQTTFVFNRFKIPEPIYDPAQVIAPEDLDLVLVPLVAFDHHCHRIGMGAGFYDRTFAFLNTQPRPTQPILCGLAHGFQQIEDTHPQEWDVQLNMIMTELSIFKS